MVSPMSLKRCVLVLVVELASVWSAMILWILWLRSGIMFKLPNEKGLWPAYNLVIGMSGVGMLVSSNHATSPKKSF